MSFDPSWTQPKPGPWMQDRAHNPAPNTMLAQAIYPAGFNRGFEETCCKYGTLIDRLAMSTVNGYTYHQPQPFDMPGPDGPKTPEELGAEFGRRVGVASNAFDARIWNDDLTLWDNELKPGSIRKHMDLNAVDLTALDNAALRVHIERCAAHLEEMVYQHHRFNLSALIPVDRRNSWRATPGWRRHGNNSRHSGCNKRVRRPRSCGSQFRRLVRYGGGRCSRNSSNRRSLQRHDPPRGSHRYRSRKFRLPCGNHGPRTGIPRRSGHHKWFLSDPQSFPVGSQTNY